MVTFSWEFSFYVCGMIGIALCVVFVQGVRDRPAATVHRRKSGVLDDEDSGTLSGRSPTPWRRLATDRYVILLTLSYSCFGYAGYVYFAWFYRYLVDGRNIELIAGSLLSMFPFLAMAIGSVAGGWLSDCAVPRLGALGARRATAVFGLLPAFPLVAIGSTTSNDLLAVACLSIAFGLMSLSMSAYWSTVVQIVPSHAGTAAAIMNTGLNLAGAIAPMLTPIIKDAYGWPAAWWTAGVAATGAGLLWTFLREPAPVRAAVAYPSGA
jgi:MFS transporter, ACS family, glucarate transporter